MYRPLRRFISRADRQRGSIAARKRGPIEGAARRHAGRDTVALSRHAGSAAAVAKYARPEWGSETHGRWTGTSGERRCAWRRNARSLILRSARPPDFVLLNLNQSTGEGDE